MGELDYVKTDSHYPNSTHEHTVWHYGIDLGFSEFDSCKHYIEQKYFLKPSKDFTEKVMGKIRKE